MSWWKEEKAYWRIKVCKNQFLKLSGEEENNTVFGREKWTITLRADKQLQRSPQSQLVSYEEAVFCNAAPHDGENDTRKVSLLGFPRALGEFPANTDFKTELKVTVLSQIAAACLGEDIKIR